jgi:hypothetical protein
MMAISKAYYPETIFKGGRAKFDMVTGWDGRAVCGCNSPPAKLSRQAVGQDIFSFREQTVRRRNVPHGKGLVSLQA